jgi:CRP/FNR family transcriptional regulator, cyclic AMP receptor protein
VVMENVDEKKNKPRPRAPRSRLLKVPIQARTSEGKEEQFSDYVMEVDKDRVYLKTEDPYPVGTAVNISMELPGLDRPITFHGEVVRINTHKPETPEGLDQGMGIVFERVTFDNRRLVNLYLEKIESEERSEDYSRFLSWVSKISRPMGEKQRERIKKDLLKVLYGASKDDASAVERKRKTAQEMELIAKMPLLAELEEYELEEMARIMVKEKYRSGDAVFEEGDVGDKLYVIVRGAVDIIKAAGQGPGQVLVTLRRGDYFGEMSLIDDAPRSASAMATEESSLLSIKKQDFMLLLDNSPTIAAKIYKFFVITLQHRLRETNERIKSFVSMAQEMSQG